MYLQRSSIINKREDGLALSSALRLLPHTTVARRTCTDLAPITLWCASSSWSYPAFPPHSQ